MSKANRKKRYETDKNNKKNHLLSDALRREFEGDERTAEQAETDAEKNITDKLGEDREKELFAMNRAEQVEILNNYGVTDIPKLEAGIVKKILKVQKVKNN